jgi:hypothetical protein
MTTKLIIRPSAVALAFALSACDGGATDPETPRGSADKPAEAPRAALPDPPRPASTIPEKVQLAAAVAREISAAPELADEILGKHGLDRDAFDAIVFEIASDPQLTTAYMAARRTQ